jgi:predicted nucleic acid-binding protein
MAEGWIEVEETEITNDSAGTADTGGLDLAEAAVMYHAYQAVLVALLDDEAERASARTLGVKVQGNMRNS